MWCGDWPECESREGPSLPEEGDWTTQKIKKETVTEAVSPGRVRGFPPWHEHWTMHIGSWRGWRSLHELAERGFLSRHVDRGLFPRQRANQASTLRRQESATAQDKSEGRMLTSRHMQLSSSPPARNNFPLDPTARQGCLVGDVRPGRAARVAPQSSFFFFVGGGWDLGGTWGCTVRFCHREHY